MILVGGLHRVAGPRSSALNIPLLESRVTSLESLMADLIGVVENTSRTVAQLSLEMAEFKEEMKRKTG